MRSESRDLAYDLAGEIGHDRRSDNLLGFEAWCDTRVGYQRRHGEHRHGLLKHAFAMNAIAGGQAACSNTTHFPIVPMVPWQETNSKIIVLLSDGPLLDLRCEQLFGLLSRLECLV